MDVSVLEASLVRNARLEFARSGGPGGQNVNKVNSKVLLRVDLALLEGLTESEGHRLLEKLGRRLRGGTSAPDGARVPGTELVIQVQDERSQLQNRLIAVERALAIIIKALHRDKPRRATKPSKASKERRLSAKHQTGMRKQGRGRPGFED